MKRFNASNPVWMFYFVYFLLYCAVLNRELPNYFGTKEQWLAVGLFTVYLLLMAFERLISRSFPKFIYLYFILQLGAITWLLLIPNDPADQDYFINLVLPLCGQAMWNLNEKISKYFVVLFSAFCLTTM
ncbi:MAG: hypothetical protein HGA86_04760, partial [Anaerolineaceae bacterium]|nr:hypothetical protein [Anaerolineaceae bacterium]